jgi:hypothetical protein
MWLEWAEIFNKLTLHCDHLGQFFSPFNNVGPIVLLINVLMPQRKSNARGVKQAVHPWGGWGRHATGSDRGGGGGDFKRSWIPGGRGHIK